MTEKQLKKKIKEYIDIATELCYDDKCKERLADAKSMAEIEIIMVGARKRKE